MASNNNGYHVVPFPAARQVVVDAGRLSSHRHLVHGLLEFDVTQSRDFISNHKAKTGESLSFTAFLIGCLSQAIATHPLVQAHLNWRNQLIVFDQVDVVVMIETEIDKVALPHIIRSAEHKSFYEIHREIRAIQAEPTRSDQKKRLSQWGPYAPRLVRTLFYRALRLNPHWLKKYAGTVMVTAVGMFGHGSGWGFGLLPMHTFGLTIGGIAQKPAVMDGQIVLRDYLCLTITIDHDVVDGAPAARFAQCFKELVESGSGLCSVS